MSTYPGKEPFREVVQFRFFVATAPSEIPLSYTETLVEKLTSLGCKADIEKVATSHRGILEPRDTVLGAIHDLLHP